MEREDGSTLTYSYDADDRLIGVAVAANGASIVGTAAQSFSYDGAGRCLTAFDDNGGLPNAEASWTYDLAGRVLTEALSVGGAVARTVSSGYTDGFARRTSLTYPNGRTMDMRWWPTGALEWVKGSGAATAIATYDWIGGRLLKRTMQNGVNLDMTAGGGGTQYDGAGRPIGVEARSVRGRHAHRVRLYVRSRGEQAGAGFGARQPRFATLLV